MFVNYRELICHDIYDLIILRSTWRATAKLDFIHAYREGHGEFCAIFPAHGRTGCVSSSKKTGRGYI